MIQGIVDEIGHDEKIPRKTHFQNNFELVFKPVLVLTPHLRADRAFFLFFSDQPRFQSFPGRLDQHVVQTLIPRHLKHRKFILAEPHLILAQTRHMGGVIQGFRIVRKCLFHLSPGFEVKFVRRKPKPFFLINTFSRLNAEQNVMGLSVFTIQVMTVIGGHHGDGQVFTKFTETSVHFFLFHHFVGLEFQKKPVPVKDRRHFLCFPAGGFHFPGIDEVGDMPRKAG